jgi:hypothetical protein
LDGKPHPTCMQVGALASRLSQRPSITEGARDVGDGNNHLAGEPVRVPVVPKFTLKSGLDKRADQSCAEALMARRLNGRAVCLRPADHNLRLATRPHI